MLAGPSINGQLRRVAHMHAGQQRTERCLELMYTKTARAGSCAIYSAGYAQMPACITAPKTERVSVHTYRDMLLHGADVPPLKTQVEC